MSDMPELSDEMMAAKAWDELQQFYYGATDRRQSAFFDRAAFSANFNEVCRADIRAALAYARKTRMQGSAYNTPHQIERANKSLRYRWRIYRGLHIRKSCV